VHVCVYAHLVPALYKDPTSLRADNYTHACAHTYTQFITLSNSEGKVVPVLFLTKHHTLKANWGSGVIEPCIVDLSTRWR
jgi:hypothetical protein